MSGNRGAGQAATSSDATTTSNEFAKLDIEIGGTGANRASANTYSLWMGTAADNTNWLGMPSGYYYSGFDYRGNLGGWSSTAHSASYVYVLTSLSNNARITPASNFDKDYGFSVRCVL